MIAAAELRKQAYARARGFCECEGCASHGAVRCMAPLEGDAWEVQRIVVGGANALNNVKAVCKHCSAIAPAPWSDTAPESDAVAQDVVVDLPARQSGREIA